MHILFFWHAIFCTLILEVKRGILMRTILGVFLTTKHILNAQKNVCYFKFECLFKENTLGLFLGYEY